jgi:MFS family permease
MILLAREKPPTPPSESASIARPAFELSYELKRLIANRSYCLVALDFALLYGTVSAIGAIISSLTAPYNYSGRDNSLFGGLFISCGITGSLLCGIALDKKPKYKLSVLIVSFSSIIFLLTAFYSLPSRSSALLGLNLAALGFFAVPMSPISFAFSVELTYPTPDAVSNGMMVLASKIYGALLSVIGGILAKKASPLYALGLFTINNMVALVAALFIKEELRRLRPKTIPASEQNTLKTETEEKEKLIE